METKVSQHEVSRELGRQITAEIEKAISGIFEKHGLKGSRPSTKYGYLYSFKIEASPLTEGANGVNLTSKGALDWIESAWRFSVQLNGVDAKSLLGKKFSYNFRDMVFNGYNPKKRKYPLMATDSKGAQYGLPVTALTSIVGSTQKGKK